MRIIGSLVLCCLTLCATDALSQTAKDFKEGVGYYYKSEGKFHFLCCRTKINFIDTSVAPRISVGSVGSVSADPLKALSTLGVDPNHWIGTVDISTLQNDIHEVSAGVRFFSYGFDFSRLGTTPPAEMLAFCQISREASCPPVGAFLGRRICHTAKRSSSLRLRLLGNDKLPIYEISVPDLTKNTAGIWAINIEPNCDSGWLFRLSTATPMMSRRPGDRETGPPPRELVVPTEPSSDSNTPRTTGGPPDTPPPTRLLTPLNPSTD